MGQLLTRFPRRARLRFLLVSLLLIAGVTAPLWRAAVDQEPAQTEALRITGAQAPWDREPVSLDATLYRPKQVPAPAIILAHGFGGSKDSVAERATELTRQGFLVMTYSARGFGASTGEISLDSLDAEIPDARKVLDHLATRPEVLRRGGDPVVGVVGGSYGGAAALMLAGTDPRVDAVVASITWHDLGRALFASGLPGGAGQPQAGVFKRAWVSTLLGSVATSTSSAPVGTAEVGSDPGCGRLRPELCDGYAEALRTGTIPAEFARRLSRSNPSAVLDRVTAPTLLIQGEADTLFGLEQAEANAAALQAAGTTVALHWFAGGHDGGDLDDRTTDRVTQWLRHYLIGGGEAPSSAFRFPVTASQGPGRAHWFEAPAPPGTSGESGDVRGERVRLDEREQAVTNPVGGLPAAITSVPGLSSGLAEEAAGAAAAALPTVQPPGQSATFIAAPRDGSRVVVGSATVPVRVTAKTAIAEPLLFASIGVQRAGSGPNQWQVAGRQVAPIRLPAFAAGQSMTVSVQLPSVVFRVNDGDRVAVRLATTDQAFSGSVQGAAYRVAPVGPLTLPPTIGAPIGAGDASPVVLMLLLGLALLGAGGLWWVGRGHRGHLPSGLDGPPLSVRALAKSYAGLPVVRSVSFDVRPGRVVGLLGPNGAGKTTTLRMVMGLIEPTDGEIEVFGHRVRPGHPALRRVGSLVEGAGFLPQVSGWENLRLFWQATGRPMEEAALAEVLEIAGLGEAVRRRVGTYSQGMRQRLAIAQAMLGLPDLLILDEPTNGLDPPQIHAMRQVLRRYADGGRTVLVSSHLLAEVEQTCDDVVVIHRGRTVAAGRVAELTASTGEMVFRVDDPTAAVAVLRGLDDATAVSRTDDLVLARVADPAVAVDRLVRAGVAVSSASARHRLEDVFLQLVDDSAHRTRQTGDHDDDEPQTPARPGDPAAAGGTGSAVDPAPHPPHPGSGGLAAGDLGRRLRPR